MNPNYDEILSTTLENYRSSFADNLSKTSLLFWWLSENGRKIHEDGGESITVPLLYGDNETVKSYSGYEEIDVTPQAGMTAANFPWKQVAGTVSISRLEERKNSGEQRIINLLDSKIKQLEISFRKVMNTMLFSDGQGNGGKDFFGLNLLVEDGTAWGTVGGIDSNAYPYWRNVWKAAVGVPGNYEAAMRSAYNSASLGNEHPHLGITTQLVHENYEGTLVNLKRYEDSRVGEGGFDLLKFKGLLLGFDADCPAETMFFLNSDYLNLTIDKETDFITTPFVTPENQDAKTAKVLLMGNMVVANRARQARLGGMTS